MYCGVLTGSASLFQVPYEEGARAIPAGRVSGFGSAKAGTSPLSLPHSSHRIFPSCQSHLNQGVSDCALAMAVMLNTYVWGGVLRAPEYGVLGSLTKVRVC